MISHEQIRKIIWIVVFFALSIWAQSTPPPGALIVRQSSTSRGEHATISSAVAALSSLSGSKTIFIYPGSYNEQIRINYPYSLSIQGYSTNPTSAASNQVTVKVAISAAQVGSNVKSAAIWAKSEGNVINSFGTGTDTQALALASTGNKQVFKYCTFSSFQDTVEVEGTAYFLGTRIEGATAWFESVILAVKATTFQALSQVISAGATAGSTYLGRPWSQYASVAFQFCSLSNVINPAGWSIWAPNDPRTADVSFAEYQNVGPGANPSARRFGTQRSSPIPIGAVLGSDYNTWIN
ncbi:pectinesterase [Puccinia sorghi]|uniref:pectinesterase n=1 Tax=Puccinia sorghi TaxID=27349 RepID=A0A0L6U5D0_9BASI|nr:pectinesterase [Puccinia sorghi]